MKHSFATRTAVALAAGALLLGASAMDAAAKRGKVPKLLEWNAMIGVAPAMTGTQSPIRGINGGGIPWMIAEGAGELGVDGHLEIAVSGLVFAAGPNAGSNTVANFRATVSCLNADGSVTNVQTGVFPATQGPASSGGGNADIEADLQLPQPCIAPLVFVTSPTGAWFATIGH